MMQPITFTRRGFRVLGALAWALLSMFLVWCASAVLGWNYTMGLASLILANAAVDAWRGR